MSFLSCPLPEDGPACSFPARKKHSKELPWEGGDQCLQLPRTDSEKGSERGVLRTPYTEAQSSAIQANDLPKVLDMTGSAELSTRIDTQFPMIYRKEDRAVTQGKQNVCTQGH